MASLPRRVVWSAAAYLCCVGVSAPARAQSPDASASDSSQASQEAAPTDAGDTDAEQAEARALYDRGLGRYETADYKGAIELWTDAFSSLPNEGRFAGAKADIIYNLARAHERQYDVDNDPAQLRQALILLDRYVDSLGRLYADADDVAAQRSRAHQVRADIQDQLDAHVAANRDANNAGQDASAQRDPGKGLVIAGAVLTGVGAASLGLAGATMALGAQANDISDIDPSDPQARRERFDRGRTMNALAITGGIGAALFIGSGVALIVVGKKKSSQSDAQARAKRSPRFAPWFGPDGAGILAQGRF